MALIECKECKKQISSDAASCPHCGKPIKTENPTQVKDAASGCLGIIFLALIFFAAIDYFSGDKSDTESVKAEKEKCKIDDLQCRGNALTVFAGVYCPDKIEQLALHSVKWTDGIFEPKFSRFRWTDKVGGSITVIGDRAEFQNGFGAYTPVIYQCMIDSSDKNIIDVKVSEGRLPK